ncbi:MAG: thioredoxin family protein [Thermoanaerobaculia bacterium]
MKMSNPLRATLLAAATILFVTGGCGSRSSAPASGGGAGQVEFVSLSFSEALGHARTEKRLVMIDVYTDWCGWCKKLDNETFADRRVAEALRGVIAIKVNAEKGGEAVAEQYHVRGFPTVIFVSGSGEIVRKVEGYVGTDEMLQIVASLKRPA